MQVGVSTATFFTKLLTEDSFSVIRQCGGDCAEVFLTTYSEFEPEFGNLLVERSEGLPIYSIHSLTTAYEPQLFNAAPRTREDAERWFRKVLAVGQTLGAKYHTFHGSTRLKKTAYIDPVVYGKRLAQLGEITAEYGITLCLETVHWCAFNSPSFFATLKSYAPNIGVTLDVKQAWQSGFDFDEYLDVVGDRLKNVHICDKNADESTCMVGDGEFPFDRLVNRLALDGYDGPLIIEQYAKDYQDFSQVARSVSYVKKIIGGIYAH